VFDFFRTFRRWRGWGPVITFGGDIFFSLIAMFILYRLFARANALAFRFYNIWGSLLGLILYLRFFSKYLIRCYFTLYQLITDLAKLIARGIMVPARGIVLLMRPPYAILRWFSLLFYRIGEHIVYKPILSLKLKIRKWWKQLWPPGTNG
jgi:hypothetical protein